MTDNTNSTKQRLLWLDMAKGYGILFIIWAHLDTSLLSVWMYSFHVPLFFILAGFTFNTNTTFSTFLAKKSKSLLLPYLCLGGGILLYYILNSILNGAFTWKFLLDLMLDFLLQRRFLPLWFITTLFLLNLIAYPMIRFIKNKILLFILSILFAIVAMVYYSVGGGYLLWNIDVCFAAMPFFIIGHLCKENHEKIKNFFDKKIKIFVAFIIFLIINVSLLILSTSMGYKVLDMYSSTYGCQPLTYISAISGSFAIIMLSHLFDWKPILYIGKNSLLYFVWHLNLISPIVTKIFSICGFSLTATSSIFLQYAYQFAVFFIVIGLLTICNFIIEKTKLKFMLGK